MVARLLGAGVTVVDDPADAQVILVNTCPFVEDATQESIDTILALAEYKKAGRGSPSCCWPWTVWRGWTGSGCCTPTRRTSPRD